MVEDVVVIVDDVAVVVCAVVVELDHVHDVVVDDADVVVLYQADVVLYHGEDVVEAEHEARGGVKLPETQVSQSACSPH